VVFRSFGLFAGESDLTAVILDGGLQCIVAIVQQQTCCFIFLGGCDFFSS
jgi:hypothetical protein